SNRCSGRASACSRGWNAIRGHWRPRCCARCWASRCRVERGCDCEAQREPAGTRAGIRSAAFPAPAVAVGAAGAAAAGVGAAAAHLLPHLLDRGESRRGVVALCALLLGVGIAVLALAGPSWRQGEQPLLQGEAPLVVALDLSSAMLASDLPPSRLLQARAK